MLGLIIAFDLSLQTNTSGLFGIRDIKEAIPQLFLSDGKTVAVKDKVSQTVCFTPLEYSLTVIDEC